MEPFQLTSSAPSKRGRYFKTYFFKLTLQIGIMSIFTESATMLMSQSPLMINQHWFR